MSDRAFPAPNSGPQPDTERLRSGDLDGLGGYLRHFGQAGGENYVLGTDAAGRLVVQLPDGQRLAFPGTETLVQALAGRLVAFTEELRMSQVDIDRLLRGLERQLEDHKAWDDLVFRLDRQLADIVPHDGGLTWRRSVENSAHLESQYNAGKIGRGIDHLPPLPGENFLFASDARRLTEITRVDADAVDPRGDSPRDSLGLAGVGLGITHLPPMPDGARGFVGDSARSGLLDQTRSRISDTGTPPQQPRAGNDSYQISEDGRLSGRLFDNDFLPNGARDIRLAVAPASGMVTISEDGFFSYIPGLHFSGDVTFTYAFTDPRTGTTVTADVRITIVPVADSPVVAVPAGPFFTEEDTPILISGLGGMLVDQDGSESLRFRLEGVPAGADFGGRGIDLGGGNWQFTPDELATPLNFTPPQNWHGTVNFTLVGIAREAANGAEAETRRSFTLVVDAQADAPIVTTGTTRFNEDAPTAFGPGIRYALVDSDGSERVSRVDLSGVPANVTISYTPSPGATVTRIGQLWRIEGDQAAIRTTLDSFKAERPLHGDADFAITVAVTTTDADGSTALTTRVHNIITDALADAPTVTGSATGLEDTTFAVPVTVNLVDQDGSERLAHVDVSGVPTGGTLGWNIGLPGTVTALGGGTTRFSGTTAQIQALLASLTIAPPAHSDVDFNLTVTAVSEEFNPSETGGVAQLQATTIATIPVTVTAVADTPNLAATSITGNEDAAIAFGPNISFAVTDTDGSEAISKLRIAGIPAGAALGWNTGLPGTVTNLGGGIFEVTGTEAQIRALVTSLNVTPPANSDADFSLTLTVTARDNDGSTATRSTTQNIVVTAVADAPTATAGAGTFNVDQDVATALPGLGGALTDTDGSETLAFRLGGIPAGSTFNRGTDLSGGIWQFTPADLVAGLIFTPPLFYSGTVNATLSAISTETSNGSSATTSLPVTLVVGAIADPATVNTTSSTGNEDASIPVGTNITYALTDTDGSEVISRVAITGIPAGALTTYTAIGTATITAVTGGYRIDGPQADIRATLDTLRIQPPANSDANIALTVAVTSKELANGNSVTATGTHNLIVKAVADAPTISGSATGNEDASIAVPITVTLGDTDGSESLAYVEVSGVPAGAVLAWNLGLPGSVTNPSAGLFRFTGTTGQIQALLASLTITPPSNSDTAFNLSVVARATESAPSEAGEITLLNRDTSFTVPVTVTAVADLPTVSAASSTVNEDTAVIFGSAITYALTDTDGSEAITKITLSAFPAGSTVAYTATGGGAVAFDGTTYTITGSAAGIRATLNTFAVTAPLNSDADFTLNVGVTTTDTGGVTATRASTHDIIVNPVSDTPTLAATTVSGREDTFINFGAAATWVKPDNDGSERVSRVEITGFGSATAQYTATGGATVTAITGGFAITGPNEAGIRATLNSFAIKQVLNSDTDITLTIKAQTTDGVAAASSFATTTQLIDVIAQADAPTIAVGAISGNEDTPITFGDRIVWTKPDNDGSEWISRATLTGFPAGWAVTYTPNGAVTVTGDAQSGYTLSIAAKANEALLRAVLDSFKVQGPANSDADFTIQTTATTTDADGSTATSAAANVAVVVIAVADMPSSSATNVTVNEDTPVLLTLAAGASADNDGSETLTQRITGVPTGATFNRGTNTGGGVWTFTAADIAAGVSFTPPSQYSGTISLVLVSRSTETSNGFFAESSSPFTVTVNPILDPVTLTNSAQGVNEDVVINVGAQFTIALADLDGSQNLTYRVSGIPAGYTVGKTLTGATTLTDLGGGVFEFAGPNAGDVITSLRTMTLTPGGVAANRDANFTLTLDATTVETGGATSTSSASHAITVSAVADTPNISASNPTVNEDPAGPIAFPVTVSLVDTDGSESLNQVDVIFTAWAGTIPSMNWNGILPGTVTAITNGYRFTGTTAEVTALVASITITPQANNGTDIGIRVTARSQETNPTDGEVATLTASRTSNFTINMVPVADQPVVTAPGIGVPYNTNEDTAVTLTGLGGALTDTDGSEVLSYRILGVPTGASFGGVGTNLGGGIWSFTKAQVDAGLSFTPTANASGTFDMTLRAIATETENSATSTNDATFRVIVGGIADVLNITGSSAINEDTATTIGQNIAIALTDTDGSEYISQVVVSGFPVGAVVSFGASDPAVTVSGSGSGPYTLAIASSANAAKLRTVLDSLGVTAPANSDVNFTLNIAATNIDQGGATQVSNASHVVTVKAVADAPTVTANNVSGTEDVVTYPLALSVVANDTDGSETLSARILDVPTGSLLTASTAGGGTFVNNNDGTWSITAPTTAQLNAILGSVSYTPVLHSSNAVTMRLEVTSTEAATGGEVATKTSTVLDPFTITLQAVADTPVLKVTPATGGNSGREDTPIPLGISAELVDKDGSEILSVSIAGVPAGARFVNALGIDVGTNAGGGVWSIPTSALADLRIIPPLNSNVDFTLSVTLTSTETVPGNPGNGDIASVTLALPVNLIGIADTPNLTVNAVMSPEDNVIPLGASITGSLADTDGSEVLYYVLSGLPAGVLPSVGTYIGGEWQISATDLPLLTIPVPAQFSGNYTATYAPTLSVRAVAQENDGDQTSVTRALQVTITPVIDAFTGWAPSVQVNEDNNISLANAAGGINLIDNDGSEKIVSYTFNLNGVIAAAQISATVPNVTALIASYITGTFTNNGNGTITVLAADLAGVAFRASAFKDSNIDFSIPVSALVSESGGLTQAVNGTYSVDLVGVADAPTVYAQNVTGTTGQLIRLNPNSPTGHNFGGDIVDTDVAAGRANSERIYYFVSGMNSVPGLDVAFFNSSGQVAGLNNNDGTWYLTAADLNDLHIVSRYGQTGNITLSLTSITEENDGSTASSSAPATFTATFTPDTGGGGGNITPFTPVINITPMTGLEDGLVNFTVTVSADPADPSPVTPTVVLLISNIPAGARVVGATLNPSTGRYIATAADLASGLVKIYPPANFSGALNLTVEAVATNTQLNNATTGPQVVTVTVTPVADGPNVSANPVAGREDTATNLNIGVTLRDTDAASPETLVSPIRITLTNGATLSAGTLVSPGVYDLTLAQLAGLKLIPATNLHGPVAVSVSATSVEPGDGDSKTTVSNFTVNVAAIADAPLATASDVSGAEDSTIALTGLSAALVDTDGSERLSVKITGIPEGSILSAGANNGDGSWTVSPGDLATLTIKPPKNYSGDMSLELRAFSLDASGDTATTIVPFHVIVTPVADTVVIAPVTVTGNEDVVVALALGIKLADATGILAGENPSEKVELTFSGLETGAVLQSTGGTLVQLAPDQWRFTGTAAEAATLGYVGALHFSGTDLITVDAVAIDGASRSAVVTDSFSVTLAGVADAPTITGFSLGTPGSGSVALNIAATFPDTDGSETHLYRISGLTGGAAFSAGTDLGGGVWQFTEAQASSLSYLPGSGGGTASLVLEARATETVGGSTASVTSPLSFTTGDSGSNAITGTAGNDRILGFGGDDTISGGAGVDTMTGGTGADTFTWIPAHTGGGADIITDFNIGESDKLNLSALLTGYNPGVTPLTDFVQFTDVAGNTQIDIAPTGGAFTTSLAILQGVTGLNVETLRLSGNIIA
jgi:large repetitive protein